ncbi:MAG: Lrp/AsnC family transcriptional regulator [Candidatus Aenigmarchaeota archaeon]|nr:Lrp/AsnC family transcriptional regulator [Candidatus Aenigmarchaeota archaeon]
MRAFILISLREPKEKDILKKLNSMKEVVRTIVLFGEWDMMAEVDVENTDKLGNFVIEKVRSIPEINLTSTLIAA